jgi:hypothetical protein
MLQKLKSFGLGLAALLTTALTLGLFYFRNKYISSKAASIDAKDTQKVADIQSNINTNNTSLAQQEAVQEKLNEALQPATPSISDIVDLLNKPK